MMRPGMNRDHMKEQSCRSATNAQKADEWALSELRTEGENAIADGGEEQRDDVERSHEVAGQDSRQHAQHGYDGVGWLDSRRRLSKADFCRMTMSEKMHVSAGSVMSFSILQFGSVRNKGKIAE